MTIKAQLQCATCHWQTLSYNIVSSTPCQRGIQTHNVSGDKYWLLRYICNFKSNLPYDNDGTSLIQEDIGDFKYGLVIKFVCNSYASLGYHSLIFCFCDVRVSVLDFIVVDLVRSTQLTNKMCICCLFTKHAAFRNKDMFTYTQIIMS
jgi:hypothetical protein